MSLLLITALTAGVAYAEGRNFDARDEYNANFTADRSAGQAAATSDFVSQLPGTMARYDKTMGVVRTLSRTVGYLTEPSSQKMDPVGLAYTFAVDNHEALGLTLDDLDGYEVTDMVFSKVTGADHVYLRQVVNGFPVYNGQLHVNINREGRVMSVNNAFVSDVANAVNAAAPVLTPQEAVHAASLHLGLSTTKIQSLGGKNLRLDGLAILKAPSISSKAIETRLMYLPIRQGDARLVYNFQIETRDGNNWWDITVDALDGTVWTVFDWVSDGTYNVFQEPDESPLHGSQSRTSVVNPELAGPSPNGWFTGGTMSGNNVTACPDTSPANNVCDSNPQCSGTTCNFPLNLGQAPSQNVGAAVSNLFYWNNYIHDTQYLYGFDEPGGNFQENNFGNGGAGGDSVNADAQDGSGNCNANFATPTDGGNPRMQMFTCTNASPARDGDFDNGVIVHEYGHGISIRQVGGPGNSSCLNNTQQPGEGWSDVLGLIYTHEPGDAGTDTRGIGSYLFALTPEGGTIRDLPYSTNNAVNNWTYESIGSASIPHGVGSRWAQAVWEVYWALVDKHGFDPDLQNSGANAGNHRAMLYINEGLKNTACSPTFLDTRDGIVQAANDNNGGVDVCDVWQAFAGFGLGVDATTGGPSTRTATNGFALPAECGGDPPPPPPPPPPPGGCPTGWTTWTGTATAAGQNFVTSTFTGSGQTCNATLSCDAGETGSDLDLYIDGESCDFFGCVWNALAGSTSPNCAEALNGTCNSGTFRWRVNVFSLVGPENFTICTSPGAP